MIFSKFNQNYKINNLLFDIAWVIFLAYNILENSAWVALSEGWTYTNISRVVKYVCAALCLVVILFNLVKKRYSKQAVIAYILLGIIIAGSAYFGYFHTYVWYFFIFAAAYKQDAERVVALTACVTALMLIIIVGCSQVGLAIDYIFNPDTRERHGLGFGWTTTAPIMFFFFILQYVFIRREKMKFYEYIFLEAVVVFFYIMTNTQMTFYISTAFLIFMFVEGLMKKRWNFWRKLKWFWIALPLIIFVLTFIIFMVYNRENEIWYNINNYMHNRLNLGQDAIREYGITILGQPIIWRGYFITVTEVANYNFVDCSYIQLMLSYGVLFILATVAIYTNGMFNAIKARRYHLVWILAVVLAFSVVEPRLMNLTFNVFPLMAFLSQDDECVDVKSM